VQVQLQVDLKPRGRERSIVVITEQVWSVRLPRLLLLLHSTHAAVTLAYCVITAEQSKLAFFFFERKLGISRHSIIRGLFEALRCVYGLTNKFLLLIRDVMESLKIFIDHHF